MSTFTKNLREKISGLSPRDLVYPGVVVVFFVVVFILFFLATQFLSKSINSAFLEDIAPDTSTLNMGNYTLVANKLGVSTERKKEEVPTIEVTLDLPETQDVIEKSSLSLRVLNASGKSGAAGALASALENAGFAKASVGNQSKSIPTTTIVIKESIAELEQDILGEVAKKYPDASITTTTEDVEYDILITIGGK